MTQDLSQPSLTITADELGRMLQPTLKDPGRWLINHQAELAEQHGMPRKLPGGHIWSRLQVMTWIATFGASTEVRAEAGRNLIRQQQDDILKAFGRVA